MEAKIIIIIIQGCNKVNEQLYQVLIQAGSYGLVILASIILFSAILRGFFWKYFKVRTSFGKLILIKIRSSVRDYYQVGSIDEGFLVFKHKKDIKRLSIDNSKKLFYKCLGVLWVDVDEEKNALCCCDYSIVPGFDTIKFSDMLTRALTRPTISSGIEKVIIVLLIILVVGVIVSIYLSYKSNVNSQTAVSVVTNFISTAKGSVISSSTTI